MQEHARENGTQAFSSGPVTGPWYPHAKCQCNKHQDTRNITLQALSCLHSEITSTRLSFRVIHTSVAGWFLFDFAEQMTDRVRSEQDAHEEVLEPGSSTR